MDTAINIPFSDALAAAHGDLYLRARASVIEALKHSRQLGPVELERFIETHVENYINGALTERARLKAIFERSAGLPEGRA
jgi:hypothetical protein